MPLVNCGGGPDSHKEDDRGYQMGGVLISRS
jgi:hypothetical protein